MIVDIEYRGQKFPLIKDYYALSRVLMENEDHYHETGKEINGFVEMELLFYYGIERALEKQGKPFTIEKDGESKPFTKKDATFLVADLGFDKADAILKKFDEPEEDADEEVEVREDLKKNQD